MFAIVSTWQKNLIFLKIEDFFFVAEYKREFF